MSMPSTHFERLVVIVADRLSELVSKGELVERYYNPGNLFREVHLIMTNDDHPEPREIQKTAGGAVLHIHNLPAPSLKETLGWQPFMLEKWVASGRNLIGKVAPNLIRTHNNFLEGYLACRVKKALAIPYIVSLHGVWDRDCLSGFMDRFRRFFRVKLERESLAHADGVIAVYAPILRYAREYGARKVELIYNAVSGCHIRKKESYRLASPPRLLTINRQVREKNPEQIIRAAAALGCCYTLVGDGELHEHLREVARQAGCAGRVEFIRSMSNEKLCAMLGEFDIMVSHCDYLGISKTLIEAALAGLPVVINRQPFSHVPDLEGEWVTLCENTPEGYGGALRELLDSEEKRRDAGLKAHCHAHALFDPAAMEEKVVALYRAAVAGEAGE